MDTSLGHRGRLLVIVLCLLALGGLTVWYGTLSYDPDRNHFPDNDDVGPDPEAYVGDRVSLGGTVVATDPVTVEAIYGTDDSFELVLENVDEPLEVGDRMSAFGTLTDPSTLDAERTIVRAPWELLYMYLVSFLGGLLVLGRFVRGWNLDRSILAFVPTTDSRIDDGDRDD